MWCGDCGWLQSQPALRGGRVSNIQDFELQVVRIARRLAVQQLDFRGLKCNALGGCLKVGLDRISGPYAIAVDEQDNGAKLLAPKITSDR
jgi:hypothetical protein